MIRSGLVLALSIVFIVSLAAMGWSGTGFTTDYITDWPRPWPEESRQREVKVASNGESFLVAWYEDFMPRLYAARISQSGELIDPDGILIEADTVAGPWTNSLCEPAVCAVGDEYWLFNRSVFAQSAYPELGFVPWHVWVVPCDPSQMFPVWADAG